MDQIVLNPDQFLVSELPNYFKKKDASKVSMDAAEFNNFKVGIIKHVGKNYQQAGYVGKVIYFKEGMSTPLITVKGIGDFYLVPDNAKLLIRLDQDENNY